LISLIGGDKMDHILLRLFNECTEALGSVDKEGLILAIREGKGRVEM
jgi:hypothetical protein